MTLACGSREDAAPACIEDFEVTPREGGHARDLPFLPIPIEPKRVAAEIPVRDLNFDLKRLQAAHADGFHGMRTARSYALAQIADTLHELAFRGLRATGLRRKHIVALVKEWKRQGRSIGTMRYRTAHIRWWARRTDRPGVVPSNGELGIANREYVTNDPSCPVPKIIMYQYVERQLHRPVTTFVRTRRRCVRIKGLAGNPGVAEGLGSWLLSKGALAKPTCYESQWSVGKRSVLIAAEAMGCVRRGTRQY